MNAIELAKQAAAKHGHTLKDVPEPETVEFIEALVALVISARDAELLAVDMKPFQILSSLQSGTEDVYRPDQLRAAVLKERERCAHVVKAGVLGHGECAAAIRKGEPC